jgi:hypothetical protein
MRAALALTPNPSPRGRGESFPFSLGEKVARIGRSEERPFFRTGYGAG